MDEYSVMGNDFGFGAEEKGVIRNTKLERLKCDKGPYRIAIVHFHSFIQNALKAELPEAIKAEVTAALSKATEEAGRDLTKAERDKLAAQVRAKVTERVTSEVTPRVKAEVAAALKKPVDSLTKVDMLDTMQGKFVVYDVIWPDEANKQLGPLSPKPGTNLDDPAWQEVVKRFGEPKQQMTTLILQYPVVEEDGAIEVDATKFAKGQWSLKKWLFSPGDKSEALGNLNGKLKKNAKKKNGGSDPTNLIGQPIDNLLGHHDITFRCKEPKFQKLEGWDADEGEVALWQKNPKIRQQVLEAVLRFQKELLPTQMTTEELVTKLKGGKSSSDDDDDANVSNIIAQV